jgi:hypothetical protein
MASTDLPATDLRPTLIQQIAGNVLGVAAAATPLEVVEHTKALMLDSVGCGLEPALNITLLPARWRLVCRGQRGECQR